MKLTIEQSPKITEAEVNIRCARIDEEVQWIIDGINRDTQTLPVRLNGVLKVIRIKNIFYFESVDEKSFVYCEDEVYSTDLRLYEIEELVKDSDFVRVSKSSILNIDVVESVKALLNGKLEALLQNGEKLIINRHYVPDFKKKFGL